MAVVICARHCGHCIATECSPARVNACEHIYPFTELGRLYEYHLRLLLRLLWIGGWRSGARRVETVITWTATTGAAIECWFRL
jgi:hypothetical protein